MNKKTLWNLVYWLFGGTAFLSIIISALESATYSGFFERHFYFSPMVITGTSVVLAMTILSNRNYSKKFPAKRIFIYNFFVFLLILTFYIAISFFEKCNYPNYVFSSIHIQPKLFFVTVVQYFFLVILNLALFVKIPGAKSLPQISGKSLYHFYRFVVWSYALSLGVYLAINSYNFVRNFYRVDRSFKQENELTYALGKMSIDSWVHEYFPKSEQIVNWCDNQSDPVDLLLLDPQMIWLNYEALSRVFLTNCRYVNAYSIQETYKHLERDSLFIVSITPCDKNLLTDGLDPKTNTFDYFRYLNNQYICKSNEVVPGIYLYNK